jgi:hypothetical protein
MYAKFAARDASIIAIAAAVWWLVAARSAGTGYVSDFTGFVAGLLVGVSGVLLHEWGHLLAAVACGSVLQVNHNLRSTFIYSFDTRRNSLGQFVIMSLGGLAVTAALVISFYVWLPDTLLASRVARGVVLFLAFLGVTLELPLFLFALATRRVPGAAAVYVQSHLAQ